MVKIKILKQYLNHNVIHPIEGFYHLVYNGKIRFKVFIYKSNIIDGFLVSVIEHNELELVFNNQKRFTDHQGLPMGKYQEEYDLIYDNYMDEIGVDSYPFSGENGYIIRSRYRSSFNNFLKNVDKSYVDALKDIVFERYKKRKSRGDYDANHKMYSQYWKQYISYIEQSISSYGFIEETAVKNTYTINWFNWEGWSPSIASFDGNSLITFNLNIKNPVLKKSPFKAGFMKIYPKNNINSKSVNNIKWRGNGSGLIISKSGHIVTNHHVIKGSKSIEIELKDGNGVKKYNAEVVNFDEETDLAIIKINDENFKDFDETPNYNFKTKVVETGEKIYTYGFPMALSTMGKEIKITDGIISSKTGIRGDVKTYQISAPIQPGSSGGPLFDTNGNFIGVNSSGLKTKMTDNVGYTIKSSYVQSLIDVLPKKIEIPYSYTIRWISTQNQIKRLSEYVVLIKVK